MALEIDTDGFRSTGELVDLAGTLLGSEFDDPTPPPPCASDPASEAIMRNLNARAQWLLGHVRAGSEQAANAAAGMNDTATSYETQDEAGAGNYGQFGGGPTGGSAPVGTMSVPTSTTAAPATMPSLDPIPDVSGTDGETLAMQLETGAGPGPAVAAASRLSTLAARAQAANVSLVNAHTQLMATGESQATPGMAAKLTRGIAWTEAVAGHATALAGGYEAAGNLHTLTYSQVGPSAGWQALKTGYNESLIENAMTGGLSQPKVDAFKQALDDKEQLKGVAATGLQAGGEVVSTPPGDLPDPGMDPNGQSAPGDKDEKDGKDKKTSDPDDPTSSGMQDMLQPLMAALGPLTQSLGKANPLQSVGQMAQQIGQQVSKLGGDAAKKAASPLRPAALAKPLAGAGKGGAGGGGGGSPIKPANNLPGATHPAALTGTPTATPSSAALPMKPAAAASGASGAGGMGIAPMGHKPGGDGKASKIDSYEQPLAEVESTGRPGVVGEAPKPAAPIVNPDAQNAVKERLARRKKDAASDGDE